MLKLFKPCECLKHSLVIRKTAADRNHPHQMIMEADLHVLVLKPGNLFDEKYLSNSVVTSR